MNRELRAGKALILSKVDIYYLIESGINDSMDKELNTSSLLP